MNHNFFCEVFPNGHGTIKPKETYSSFELNLFLHFT